MNTYGLVMDKMSDMLRSLGLSLVNLHFFGIDYIGIVVKFNDRGSEKKATGDFLGINKDTSTTITEEPERKATRYVNECGNTRGSTDQVRPMREPDKTCSHHKGNLICKEGCHSLRNYCPSLKKVLKDLFHKP